MEERLIIYLEDCLAAIAAGESIESCLARYPDQAEELASLLEFALALEHLPNPGPSVATSSAARAQFLTEAQYRRGSANGERLDLGAKVAAIWSGILQRLPQANWMVPVRGLATAAFTLALLLLIGGGVINSASGSLPGDPLYGFKLLGEDLRRAVALNQESRVQLDATFSAHRREEVKQLLAIGRSEEVFFGGYLLQQAGDAWLIGDIPVVVSESTRVQNEDLSQAFVEIHGVTQANGTVQALMIETEGDGFMGRVEAIGPSAWQIAGRRVHVDSRTYVEDKLQINDCVEVDARRFPDGTLLALEIERKAECNDLVESSEDVTATPTQTPNVTPTLAATATPTPSPTWTPTPTPKPTRETILPATPTAVDDDDDKEDLAPTPKPDPEPTEESDDGDDGDDENGDGSDDGNDERDDRGGEEEDENGGIDDEGHPDGDDDGDDTGSGDDDDDDDGIDSGDSGDDPGNSEVTKDNDETDAGEKEGD